KDAETGEIYDKPVWPVLYSRVLGVLSVAMEPLDLDLIERLGEIRAERPSVVQALEHLLQFLEVTNNRYRFYHVTVLEFLTSDRTAAKADTADLYQNPHQWHQAIIHFYKGASSSWSTVDWTKMDDYGLRYLAQHLSAAEK